MSKIDDLQQALDKYKNTIPPVEKWDPPFSGDIDIVIRRDGYWFHEGDEIKRHMLAQLFASILKKEGDEYFLVTPVEKWRIQVEDAPLVVIESKNQEIDGHKAIVLKTRTNDVVLLSEAHPLQMRDGKPYIKVRHGLEALVHRNVYYQWQAQIEQHDGKYGVRSMGHFFPLE